MMLPGRLAMQIHWLSNAMTIICMDLLRPRRVTSRKRSHVPLSSIRLQTYARLWVRRIRKSSGFCNPWLFSTSQAQTPGRCSVMQRVNTCLDESNDCGFSSNRNKALDSSHQHLRRPFLSRISLEAVFLAPASMSPALLKNQDALRHQDGSVLCSTESVPSNLGR